jgi:hypothetical protein
MNRNKRSTVVAAALGVTLVAGVGVAWAQIPDATGVIHACYTKSGGSLRVIDSTQNCASRETSLSWAQAGVQGPKGDPGATGPTGAPGPQGDPGPALGASGGVVRIQSFDQPCGQDVVVKTPVHLSRASIISVDGMIEDGDGSLLDVTVVLDGDPLAGDIGVTNAQLTGQAVSLDEHKRTLVNGLLRDSNRAVVVAAGDYLLAVHDTCTSDLDTAVLVVGEIDYLVVPAA